jgi:hypothetical protein
MEHCSDMYKYMYYLNMHMRIETKLIGFMNQSCSIESHTVECICQHPPTSTLTPPGPFYNLVAYPRRALAGVAPGKNEVGIAGIVIEAVRTSVVSWPGIVAAEYPELDFISITSSA